MSFQAQARRAGQTRRHSGNCALALEQPFANSAGMKGKTGRGVHVFGRALKWGCLCVYLYRLCFDGGPDARCLIHFAVVGHLTMKV